MSQFPVNCGRKGRKIGLWTNSPQQLRTNSRSSQKIWWQNVRTTGWNPKHPGIFKWIWCWWNPGTPWFSNENRHQNVSNIHGASTHGVIPGDGLQGASTMTSASPGFSRDVLFSKTVVSKLPCTGTVVAVERQVEKGRFYWWRMRFVFNANHWCAFLLDSKQWQGLSTF